jgi:hypothetical protein
LLAVNQNIDNIPPISSQENGRKTPVSPVQQGEAKLLEVFSPILDSRDLDSPTPEFKAEAKNVFATQAAESKKEGTKDAEIDMQGKAISLFRQAMPHVCGPLTASRCGLNRNTTDDTFLITSEDSDRYYIKLLILGRFLELAKFALGAIEVDPAQTQEVLEYFGRAAFKKERKVWYLETADYLAASNLGPKVRECVTDPEDPALHGIVYDYTMADTLSHLKLAARAVRNFTIEERDSTVAEIISLMQSIGNIAAKFIATSLEYDNRALLDAITNTAFPITDAVKRARDNTALRKVDRCAFDDATLYVLVCIAISLGRARISPISFGSTIAGGDGAVDAKELHSYKSFTRK